MEEQQQQQYQNEDNREIENRKLSHMLSSLS
jgi:hypothetical protein